MAARDDFTDTVDGAAAYERGHATADYDPRDDQPTAAEVALDDSEWARWYRDLARAAVKAAREQQQGGAR